MSILLAYKRKDTVYMGTDTRVIVNDVKRNELCACNHKIQRLENGILLGASAERLERQTIFAYSDLFTLDKNGELTKKHLVKEVVPKLYKVLQREGLLVEKEGEIPYMRAVLLLAYKDTLFEICAGFTVLRDEDCQALGFASDYAQSTLMNVKETDDVNMQIVKALDIAAKYCQYVGAPYLLIDTKEGEYQLVKGDK